MAGRGEQKRRDRVVKREVENELQRVYAILDAEGVRAVRSYLQVRLGMAKPLEQVRSECREKYGDISTETLN